MDEIHLFGHQGCLELYIEYLHFWSVNLHTQQEAVFPNSLGNRTNENDIGKVTNLKNNIRDFTSLHLEETF